MEALIFFLLVVSTFSVILWLYNHYKIMRTDEEIYMLLLDVMSLDKKLNKKAPK